MNLLPCLAVVSITGVLVSAAKYPPKKNEKSDSSESPLSTPAPVLPVKPKSLPSQPAKGKKHPKAQSTTSVLNPEAKEFKLTPIPLFVPPPIPLFVPPPPFTQVSAQAASKVFTVDDLQTVLPVALYGSIDALPRGAVIKKNLVGFFCHLHNNVVFKTTTMKSMTDLITFHLNNFSMEASSQSDSQCNTELLSSLDAFLRCYTAVYMVCDAGQRQYLIENGLTKSINDFIMFMSKSRMSLEDSINLVVDRKIKTITREVLYELGFSFIRYFRSLISAKMMTNEVESRFFTFCNVFEEFLKNKKSKQVTKSLVVFGDVLSVGFQNLKEVSPQFAFATRTESGPLYIPSMMIAPFRVYITSLIQKYHRSTRQPMAEAAKSDVNLFWAFVEPAFKSFDDASQYSWKMMSRTSQVASGVQLMHYNYLQYYLHTHILGNIELALDHIDCLKMNKTLILMESASLFNAYFKIEMILMDSPCTTLLPSINQPTPYNVISGPGISNIMNSIYNQMFGFLQHNLQPDLAHELSVMAGVLSTMTNNLWFEHPIEKDICSGNFLKIQHILSSGTQQFLPNQNVHSFGPTMIIPTYFAIPLYSADGYYNNTYSIPAEQIPNPQIQYENYNYNISSISHLGQSPANPHSGCYTNTSKKSSMGYNTNSSNNSSMGYNASSSSNSSMEHPIIQAGISPSTSSQTSTNTQGGQSDSK